MNDKFVVIFYDEDRQTILDRQEVNKGEHVEYQGNIPEKPAENGVEYRFIGWESTGNLANVEENIELFAQYEESSKMTLEEIFYELSETNVEEANLNEVIEAGQKVSGVEEATRNLSQEEKMKLVDEIKQKGFVNFGKTVETEMEID